MDTVDVSQTKIPLELMANANTHSNTCFMDYEISQLFPTRGRTRVKFSSFIVFQSCTLCWRIKLISTLNHKPGWEMFHAPSKHSIMRDYIGINNENNPRQSMLSIWKLIEKYMNKEAIASCKIYTFNNFWIKVGDFLKYCCLSPFPKCIERNIFWLTIHTYSWSSTLLFWIFVV